MHLATTGILEAVATASDSTVINLGHTAERHLMLLPCQCISMKRSNL